MKIPWPLITAFLVSRIVNGAVFRTITVFRLITEKEKYSKPDHQQRKAYFALKVRIT